MAEGPSQSTTGKKGGFRHMLRWPGRQELLVLVTVMLLAGGTWAFIELADEVMEGETRSIDENILLLMRNPGNPNEPLGPEWFEEMCRDVTALGGVTVLVLLTAAACGYLILDRRYRISVILAGAVVGGLVLSLILKDVFERPRPDLVPHGSYVYTTSFPSGHSMMAAVTYLALAGILAHYHRQKRFRIYLFAIALLLMFGIGFSRVFLGVHWPTDVLAGWTAGATWTLVCLQLGHFWHHRSGGRLSGEGGEEDSAP